MRESEPFVTDMISVNVTSFIVEPQRWRVLNNPLFDLACATTTIWIQSHFQVFSLERVKNVECPFDFDSTINEIDTYSSGFERVRSV